MGSLTKDELAERGDAPAVFVERLRALGILIADGDPPYAPADVHRVRFLLACEAAGLGPEAIAEAIARGKLSLSFMDLPHYRWSATETRTYEDLAAELEVPLDLVLDVVRSLGSARPSPHDRIREDDPSIFAVMRIAAPWLGADALVRTSRVYSDALRRIAEAEASLFDTHVVGGLLAQGLEFTEAVDLANRFGAEVTPLQEELLLTLYRRQQERQWTEYTIEGIETVLDGLGLYEAPARPPAFAFIDLAGYTRATDEHGDAEAARLAAGLTKMVDEVAGELGGLPVKWLGDGVMVYFRDPGEAVPAVVDMVQRAPRMGSEAHAGVAAGPVVAQDGDFFGRTVNLAARLASRASTAQTLVTKEVVDLSPERGFGFREIGSVELRGFAEPVAAFEASAEP